MSQPIEQQKEGWEEELRDRSYALKAGFVSEEDFGRLISFIRSQRQSAEEEGKKQLLKELMENYHLHREEFWAYMMSKLKGLAPQE